MRVPDQVFSNLALRSLSEQRQRYLTSQEQAMSGSRVSRASDDPVAVTRARNAHTERRQSEDYVRATDYATSFLDRADVVIGEVNGILQMAREAAIQGMNDTLSAEDRLSLSHEIAAMADQVVTLANTKVNGRYIFSGYADDTPAIDATGAYQGTSDVPEMEIGPGLRVSIGVAGDQIFSGGADVINVVEELRLALANNDTDAMGDALDRVIDAESVVTDHWGRVGALAQRTKVAQSVALDRKLHAEEAVNTQIGIDPFESYTNMSRARGALEAAVQIASQLPPPGLVSR